MKKTIIVALVGPDKQLTPVDSLSIDGTLTLCDVNGIPMLTINGNTGEINLASGVPVKDSDGNVLLQG